MNKPLETVRDLVLWSYKTTVDSADQTAVDFILESLSIDVGRRRMVSHALHEAMSCLAAVDAFKDNPDRAYWLYVQDIGEPTYHVNKADEWIDYFSERFFYYCEAICELGAA